MKHYKENYKILLKNTDNKINGKINIYLCKFIDWRLQYPKIAVLSRLMYKFHSTIQVGEQNTKNREDCEEGGGRSWERRREQKDKE